MSHLLKNLLMVLAISILLWVGYVFFMRDTEPPLSTSGGPISEEASMETQELVVNFQRLKSYSVDGAIFDDRRFKSLVDYRVELIDEPSGRSNPFASLQ